MKSSSVMTRDVVVVSPAVTVAAAERMMERLRIRHLPVVVGGRLVGILSDRDLLRRPPATTPTNLRDYNPRLSPDTERLVIRAMSRDMDARPQTSSI